MAFRSVRQEREVIDQSAWSDLPSKVLERIINVLDPADHVAVGLVCASWRACVRESFPLDLPFEVPRLLVRRPGRDGELAFFSLQHRKILPFALPAWVRAGRCCGHVAGWLVMAFDADRSIVLCNPVSGRSIAMPRPPVFPVSKVILSSPPTSPGWIAAVLGRTGTMIAMFQPAVSGAWMTIGAEEGEQHGGFRDMAFWGGRLCAVGHDGAVLAFRSDLRARAAAVSLLREAERELGRSWGSRWQLFLVEMEGELLMVRRLYVSSDDGEVDWEVEVKLLTSPERRRWDLVAEIPGHALFVGSVVSAAVPVAPYAAASGVRGSCVYFARGEVERLVPHAICKYSLLDEEMKGVPVAGGHNVGVEPVWITPFV